MSLEETVYQEKGAPSLSTQHGVVAWQYNKPQFKATSAPSQFPSASPPLPSTCSPAEQPSTPSSVSGQINYQLPREARRWSFTWLWSRNTVVMGGGERSINPTALWVKCTVIPFRRVFLVVACSRASAVPSRGTFEWLRLGKKPV